MHRNAKFFEETNMSFRLARDLRLLHDLASPIHNANAREFQRDVDSDIVFHGCPPSPDAWGRLNVVMRKFRPRCCAKTRAGAPCIMRVVPGKRRCHFHGGLSTGPRTVEGRARIAEAQRRRWRAFRYVKANSTKPWRRRVLADMLKNLAFNPRSQRWSFRVTRCERSKTARSAFRRSKIEKNRNGAPFSNHPRCRLFGRGGASVRSSRANGRRPLVSLRGGPSVLLGDDRAVLERAGSHQAADGGLIDGEAPGGVGLRLAQCSRLQPLGALMGRELARPAEADAALLGALAALARPGADQVALELGQATEDGEQERQTVEVGDDQNVAGQEKPATRAISDSP